MMPARIPALLREWLLRLLGTFRGRSLDAEFREELSCHVELAEARFREQGYSAAEAARLARLRYGHADNALEDVRRQQGIPWFGTFTLDVKLGLRMLRKYLGLTLIGGFAMCIGFAILLAVFSYFDIVIWSDTLPLDDGDGVVAIQVWDAQNGRRSEIGIDDFERWRSSLHSIEDIGAFRTVERGIVHDNGEIEPIPVAEISAAGFDVARVAPVIGRTLRADDERVGAEPVILIGFDAWQSRFEGSDDVLGQALRINDRFHTVVGVMPRSFGFPINHEFWVPLQASAMEMISAPPAGAVFARLAPGGTLEQAQAELTATGLLPRESSDDGEGLRPTVLPYASNFVDDTDPNDLADMAGVGRMVVFLVSLMLIPPCVNIAMLVFARMVTRREEIAVRTALGASRRRIVLQLYIEMLVLSTLAVVVALLVVSGMLAVVKGLVLADLGRLPFWIEPRLTLDTLLFAGLMALTSALVIGLIPALSATRSYARPGLKSMDPRNRLRLGPVWSLLVMAQIAFAFAALPSAVELGWGTLRAHVLGPGFAAERYLTTRLAFSDVDPSIGPDAETLARYDRAAGDFIRALETDPRLLSPVAASSAVPGEGRWARVRIEGDDAEQALRIGSRIQLGQLAARSIDIDDRYLEVFDIDVLAGRAFLPEEHRPDSGSVIVDATLARDYFPDSNPLGRRIAYAPDRVAAGTAGTVAERWFEIIGVIPDRPAHPYRGSIYHPVDREALAPLSISFRTDAADGELRQDLRELAARIDPALELQGLRTLKEIYDNQAIGNYIGGFAVIITSLAVLALAAAGLYALMAFCVSQRRREIAIRMALGARPHKLLRAVFRTALRQVAVGASAGLALAIVLQTYLPARAVGGLEVPGVVPGAIALLVIIGLGASLSPARRALRTDPTECLNDSG